MFKCGIQINKVKFIFNRKGGGHGEEDIRKIAYFEQSVDPSLYKQVRDRSDELKRRRKYVFVFVCCNLIPTLISFKVYSFCKVSHL